MKVNVHFNSNSIDDLFFAGKTTVVIDVLRATSTIITALNNGAKEVIPVATVEFAVKVSGGMFGGQTLLCGERNTKKIEGFALGNSPLEYKPELVDGKTIILYTTNGTKSIVKAKFSEDLYICSFLNIQKITKRLIKLKKDVEILCSGRNGTFSLEDTVCAGKLISEIAQHYEKIEFADSAKACIALSKTFGRSIEKMLKQTEHGKLLLDNGFEEDIKYCSKLNEINILPYFNQNAIKLFEEKSSGGKVKKRKVD